MYVIIALVLLMVFGIRVGKDKLSGKISDYERAEKQRTKDWWVALVTDKKLEREMNLYFNDPENEREIDEKVLEVFKEIPECRELATANIFGKGGENINHQLKFLIFMAKNGKLPWNDIFVYIDVPYYNKMTKDRIKKVEQFIAVVKWADRQVFTYMTNAPKLVFEQRFHVGPHCNIDEAWDRYGYDGYLTWFPFR